MTNLYYILLNTDSIVFFLVINYIFFPVFYNIDITSCKINEINICRMWISC